MEDYDAIFRDMQWSRGSYHRTIKTIEDLQETHYNDFVTWKAELTKTTNEAKKLEKESRAAHKANTRALTRLLYEGPRLSKCMQQFLDAKRTQLPQSSTEPKYFEHRLNAFIALVGNRRIGAYRIADLVKFADRLQYLPERHTVDPEWRGMSIKEAIEANKQRKTRANAISYTTVKVNYIGKVKTAIRWLRANNKVEYPFAYDITFVPKELNPPITRLSLSDDQLNALFKKCTSNVESKEPADVWLPLLAFFTGARLGELVTLQPKNIDLRNGVWLVDLTTRISDGKGERNRSIKTGESRRLFALHNKLIELGFIDWFEQQKAAGHEYLFPELHRANRPQHAASKRFQRLFSSKELRMGRHRIVFHSLRHTFKDWARSMDLPERTITLQAGHSLEGIALRHGSKILRSDELRRIAELPVPSTIDFSVFEGVAKRLRPQLVIRRSTQPGQGATESRSIAKSKRRTSARVGNDLEPKIDARDLRLRLGLSQNEFAEKFGFSVGVLRDWEQGRSRPGRSASLRLSAIVSTTA